MAKGHAIGSGGAVARAHLLVPAQLLQLAVRVMLVYFI